MEESYDLIIDSENNVVSLESRPVRKTYQVNLSYLDDNGNYSERQEIYSGLERNNLALKLIDVLKEREIPDDNFSLRHFNISLAYMDLVSRKSELDPLPYQEKIIDNGDEEEKVFYHVNRDFCRSYYLCDIIKSWDVAKKF